MTGIGTITVVVTANFEANLEAIRCFHSDEDHPDRFEALLADLFDSVIPSLQQHPPIGVDFLQMAPQSMEALALYGHVRDRLLADESVRQYTTRHYHVLYLLSRGTISLLSIRHQRQLAHDLRRVGR